MKQHYTLLISKLCVATLTILLGCTKSEVGPSGLTSLVKVTQEASGTNCTDGGFKIEAGIDKNKNSVLDTDEIQNSVYVCNGAKGADGSSGTTGSSLIKVTIEATGTNCPSGGYRVDTGIDDNANGTLDTNEIDNTTYACNGANGNLVNYGKQTIVLAGDVTDTEAAKIIASDLGFGTQEVKIIGCTNLKTVDLRRLQSAISIDVYGNDSLKTLNLSGLKSITGHLSIGLSPLENLYLDSLESIIISEANSSFGGNGSSISDTKLTQLSFPSLTKIAVPSNFYIGNYYTNTDQLQSISLPKLVTITGFYANGGINGSNLEISGTQLTSLSMPVLTKVTNVYFSVDGNFSSIGFPELLETSASTININGSADFSAPKLTKGDIYIDGSFTSLSLPEMTQGSISVSSSSLTTLSLPKFTTGGVLISSSALTSLTIPELVDGNVQIGYNVLPVVNSNPNLTSLYLPKLTKLRSLNIAGTPQLSTITLPTLTSLGSMYGNSFDISGSSLSSASVNSLLANLVQISPAITGASITLKMSPAAPPTGQGLTDKATLVANGNTVTTD